jgi:hypothetical protein
MSGRELAGTIRIERPDTLILFMSGYPQNILEGQAPGAAPLEPFSIDSLLDRVREILDSYNARETV